MCNLFFLLSSYWVAPCPHLYWTYIIIVSLSAFYFFPRASALFSSEDLLFKHSSGALSKAGALEIIYCYFIYFFCFVSLAHFNLYRGLICAPHGDVGKVNAMTIILCPGRPPPPQISFHMHLSPFLLVFFFFFSSSHRWHSHAFFFSLHTCLGDKCISPLFPWFNGTQWISLPVILPRWFGDFPFSAVVCCDEHIAVLLCPYIF